MNKVQPKTPNANSVLNLKVSFVRKGLSALETDRNRVLEGCGCFMILLFNVCEELFLEKATLVKWHGQFVSSVQVASPHTRTTAKSDMTCNETDPTQSKVGVSAGYKKFHLLRKHYHLRSTG